MYSYRSYYAIFSSLFGGLTIFSVILILLLVSLIIVYIVANWKLFKKAGKHGWESIVPIYRYWVLTEIADLNWWWFLLFIINFSFKMQIGNLSFSVNICNFLVSFVCFYNIARKFGKDRTTSVFAGIFPFIFVLIFGFSRNEVYDSNIPVSKNGIFGNPDNGNNYDIIRSTNSVDNSNNNVGKDEPASHEYSFCSNCGTKLSRDMKFCSNCGKEK